MTTTEIKNLIAKARIEAAIKAVLQLTESTDLEDGAIEISRSHRAYKSKTIAGILNSAEARQEEALITNRLLNLLGEYEILQIKCLKTNLDQLRTELQSVSNTTEVKETLEDLNNISKEIGEIDYAESNEEEKPKKIGKIGQFLNRLKDPNSTASKAIQMVKNGIEITQELAKTYNSIAEWLALPQVPKLLLKKDN